MLKKRKWAKQESLAAKRNHLGVLQNLGQDRTKSGT